MTADAEKLAAFILDKANDDREYIFDIRKVTEIYDIERKIERLLEELREEKIIQKFTPKNKNSFSVVIQEDIMPKPVGQLTGNRPQNVETIPSDSLWNIIGQYDPVHERVMEQFIKPKCRDFADEESAFREFSNLFRLFVRVVDDESEEQEVDDLFQFVLDKIDEIKGEDYIKILGPDGTGKSTFLSVLYVYLYKCFRERKLAQYPFYINLHYYDSKVTEADTEEELEQKVKEKIKEDMHELIEISKENERAGFLIIIDGRDQYYRSQLHSEEYLDKIVSQIKGHKKIICLGEKTNVYSLVNREEEDKLDFRTAYIFRFSPIDIHKEEIWLDAVRKYCTIVQKEKEINPIVDCIKRFRIKEVDYNLFTILTRCSERYKLRDVKSISDLYRKYCMNYLENSKERLRISTDLAYRYFILAEMVKQHYISKNWKEWELIHQHKTISNFLLALHYAELILECKSENVEQLEYIFTNGINVFLKSIINEKVTNQRSAILFCEMMFDKGGYKAQAQAAYLVGRLEDENLQEKAMGMLEKQLGVLEEKKKEEINDARIKNKKPTEAERENSFLYRAIMVSMLYLGDDKAGEELLDTFFCSPIMNEVNRAFYLQYYNDVEYDRECVNLRDSGNDSILYTSDILYNYVYSRLQEPEMTWSNKQKYEFQIHLFTLCSLIQVRMESEESKIDDSTLEKLCVVISDTLQNVKNKLNQEMRIYLQMLKEDIEKRSFDRGHLFNELYEVKDILRRGWTDKIKKESIRKEGFRYENVIEHTYYAWLLGMLYLPETLPLSDKHNDSDSKEYNYNQYDKQKILNGLLIHALAKRYTGDKLPEDTVDKDKKEENECMRRIFMHDMYAGIAKMDDYRTIWKTYAFDTYDINGKLVKEIDTIQDIYQFCVYKRMKIELDEQKEIEWREEKSKIQTYIGVDILNEVVLKNFQDVFPPSHSDKKGKKN